MKKEQILIRPGWSGVSTSELFQPWDYHANPNNSNVQLVWTTICTIVYVVIPAGSHSRGVTIWVDLHLLFQCHIQGWRALPLKQCMFWVLCSISKRGLELKRRGGEDRALVEMELKLNNPRIELKKIEREWDGMKRSAFKKWRILSLIIGIVLNSKAFLYSGKGLYYVRIHSRNNCNDFSLISYKLHCFFFFQLHIIGAKCVKHTESLQRFCWLPVKIAPQSTEGICFLSGHNGSQQPRSYVNKRANGIPPKFKAHNLVIIKKQNKKEGGLDYMVRQKTNMCSLQRGNDKNSPACTRQCVCAGTRSSLPQPWPGEINYTTDKNKWMGDGEREIYARCFLY